MNALEEILKEKKLRGVSWEELADGLPISGEGLRVSFSRRSVDRYYLDFLLEKLNMIPDDGYSLDENNLVREPELEYENYNLKVQLAELKNISSSLSSESNQFKIELNNIKIDLEKIKKDLTRTKKELNEFKKVSKS